MPAIHTHLLLGEKSIAISNCNRLRNVIKQHQNVFFLGNQGPDPFMYYGMLPWDRNDHVEEIWRCSDDIHSGKPTAFFKPILEKVKKQQDETLIAFAAGFICHHALDSTAHPYVYYHVATVNDHMPGLHRIFEKQLDYAILTEFALNVKQYQGYHKVKVKQDDLAKLSLLVQQGAKEGLGIDIDEHWYGYAAQSFYKGEKLLYDPYGVKKNVLIWLGRFVGKEDLAREMMMPKTYDEQLDAFNRKKQVWYNPTDENVSSAGTFLQIFDLAAKKAANALAMLEKYLDDQATLQQVLDCIGDGSYENGAVDKPMYYFKKDHQNGN